MGRTAPFVVAPKSDARLASGIGDLGEDLRMDKVMADLALAFARDIEIAGAEPDVGKWSPARTLAFVVVSNVALWIIIAALIAALL